MTYGNKIQDFGLLQEQKVLLTLSLLSASIFSFLFFSYFFFFPNRSLKENEEEVPEYKLEILVFTAARNQKFMAAWLD